MKPSAYIETSVISYLTGRMSSNLIVAAHQQITQEWWDNSLRYFSPFISVIVLDEASKGDKKAAALRLAKISHFPLLKINPDIEKQAEKYYRSLRIPEKARADAYHLAIASHYKVDFLVTWNCSHLANGFVIKQLKNINSELGIRSPVICTPEELMEGFNES